MYMEVSVYVCACVCRWGLTQVCVHQALISEMFHTRWLGERRAL